MKKTKVILICALQAVLAFGSIGYAGYIPTNTVDAEETESSFVIEDGVLTEYIGTDSVVVIPFGVRSIGKSAFSGCSSLTSIEIPGSVTSIDMYAFFCCNGLTSVKIQEGVTGIGSSAFGGCSSLTNIEIPSSVINIGLSAFSDCSGLTGIKVAEENTVYDSREDCNAIIETESNELITGCSNTKIPTSVTSIKGFAFSGCSGLQNIEIPSSVMSIGEFAFSGCSGLSNIEIPSSVTSIESYAFSGCSSLTRIEFPTSVTSIGEYVFCCCSSLTSIEIPSSVISIDRYAFEDCNNLITIKGYKGSYAETYANENGYKFVNVENFKEDEPTESTPPTDEPSETPTDKDKTFYDIDGEYGISLTDVMVLLKYALGIEISEQTYDLSDVLTCLKYALGILSE